MTNQEPPEIPAPSADEREAAELQKNYAEAISRATKFLISSVILLLLLIVVVGQELREYRKKQKNLVNQIESAAKSDRGAVRKLYKQYDCIVGDLEYRDKPTDLSAKVGVSLREVPKTTRSVHKAKDIDALGSEEQKLGELINTLKEKWRQEKAKTSLNQPAAAESLPSARPLFENQRSDEGISAHEEELNDSEMLLMSVNHGDPCTLPHDLNNDSLGGLIYHLTNYKKLYNDRIGLVRELLSVTKESAELNDAKKSIPTPFGSFQIAPKLALLGLAFALVLIYFSFFFSTRKIRSLANEYCRANPGSGAPVRIPAPFWFPNPTGQEEVSVSRHPKHISDVVLSVLLHLVWLFLIAWLVFECVVTWRTTKALAFEYKSFWGYLLIAGSASAVVLAVWQFLPIRFKQGLQGKSAERGTGVRLNRRYFLGIGAVGVIGAITLGVFRFLGKQKGIPLQRRQLAEFIGTPETSNWIENKRTNAVHYIQVCSSHLPARKNRLRTITDKNRVHGGCQAQIFAKLGAAALKHKQGEVAITYYEKAIALSPLSWHLYDELCRVYGRLKRYDEIVPLFQGCLDQVKRARLELTNARNKPSAEKRLKFLHRTEKEFKSRLERTNRRKIKFEKYQAANFKQNGITKA